MKTIQFGFRKIENLDYLFEGVEWEENNGLRFRNVIANVKLEQAVGPYIRINGGTCIAFGEVEVHWWQHTHPEEGWDRGMVEIRTNERTAFQILHERTVYA